MTITAIANQSFAVEFPPSQTMKESLRRPRLEINPPTHRRRRGAGTDGRAQPLESSVPGPFGNR